MPESTGSADIRMADPDATAEEAEAAVRAVLSGSVAIVAFQQACKELPKSVSMISKFLEALEPFTFPGTQKIADVRTQPSRKSHSASQILSEVVLFDCLLHAVIACLQSACINGKAVRGTWARR